MERGGDDAIVEQQRADRQRLLRQREEAQPRAEALQDERDHGQAQRLFAQQAAEGRSASSPITKAKPRPTRSGSSITQ